MEAHRENTLGPGKKETATTPQASEPQWISQVRSMTGPAAT